MGREGFFKKNDFYNNKVETVKDNQAGFVAPPNSPVFDTHSRKPQLNLADAWDTLFNQMQRFNASKVTQETLEDYMQPISIKTPSY